MALWALDAATLVVQYTGLALYVNNMSSTIWEATFVGTMSGFVEITIH